MKKQQKIAFNLLVFIVFYSILVFQAITSPPGMQRGAVRGLAVAIPILLLLFLVATIVITRKSGGDWRKVRKNIKHNFSGLLLFEMNIRKK